MKLNVFKQLLIGAFIFLLGGVSMAQANTQGKWDKIFAKSNKVEVQKVSFKNRYGITLVGDLYIPKDIPNNAKLPAIALSGPFGAVKEQASGFYAQTLAEAGFITLAFDPSYTGESAEANPNLPKNIASPEINTDDFSAAVDFLANHTIVDSEKIGILGICGFGGFALNAAAMDTRIKAIVTSSMYDIPRNAARGYFDKQDSTKDRLAIKESLNTQRTKDFKTNTLTKAPGLPEKLKGDEPQFIKEYWDYYKTKRGFHPNSINSNAN